MRLTVAEDFGRVMNGTVKGADLESLGEVRQKHSTVRSRIEEEAALAESRLLLDRQLQQVVASLSSKR